MRAGLARRKRSGRRWLGGATVFAALLMWTAPASATTSNIYPAGSSGYDAGFPNCGETPPGGFAIVGLGDGRPFSTSSCLNSEWATAQNFAATPAPALYFNTGYSGAYGRDITSACSHYQGPPLSGLPRHDQNTYTKAWEIGCAEAAYAAGVAAANGESPSMWWADIETGNSWSTDRTVNQYTVDGLSFEMQSTSPALAGVYSYPASWDKIVGAGFTATPPFSADWGPGLVCGASGFSGAPAWVVQGAPTQSGIDTDTGCG